MSKTQSYVVFCLKCVEYDSITHDEAVNEKTTNAIALTISEYKKIMEMIYGMQSWQIENGEIGTGVAILFGMPVSCAYDIIQALKENQNLILRDLEKYNPYKNFHIPEIKYE